MESAIDQALILDHFLPIITRSPSRMALLPPNQRTKKGASTCVRTQYGIPGIVHHVVPGTYATERMKILRAKKRGVNGVFLHEI